MSADVFWTVPDRFKDGYGMNKRLVDKAHDEGCKLIITVDNGVAAKAEIEYAKTLGIDVIVTDHHKVPEMGIPTEITIDPHQDDNYPFKQICGCMVAFKLATALIDLNMDSDLYEELVTLTAIGTIADVMDLVDENRYYVKKGLEYLSVTKNIGLKTLLEKLNLYGKDLKGDDIGYIIGPCLNAAGRLETADIAVKLLLSDDPIEASKLADKIISLNDKRKDLERTALDAIKINEDDNFIIATVDGVGHGLLGLIAGKVADKYKKPCFVLGRNKEKGTLSGSGRSVYNYDLFDLIKNNRDIIVSGGGHAAACGIEIKYDDLKELQKRSNEHFSRWLETTTIDDLTPIIDIVSEIGIDLINERLISNINKLKPYGNGNQEPIFVSKKLKVESSKIVGKNKNTIQFEFSDDFYRIKAVGFNGVKQKYIELGEPNCLDVAYTVTLNDFRGRITPQIIIKDIRI